MCFVKKISGNKGNSGTILLQGKSTFHMKGGTITGNNAMGDDGGGILLGKKGSLTALLRSMGANRLQIFRYIKFPSALPQLFSGLRIAAAYSVVGAVISEWLGGFGGLGVYMTRVKKAFAFDKMFGVILQELRKSVIGISIF